MSDEDIEELAFKDTSEMLEQNKLVLLDIIDILQYDRKQWINQYTQAHNDYVLLQQKYQQLKEVIDEVREHIEEACYYPEEKNYSSMTPNEVKELLQILDKIGETNE